MLYNDEERAVMAAAIQPNMRAANISVRLFENIIADYIGPEQLRGSVLDIGPGQCDMLDLVRKAGGTTAGIDFDPAICALGHMRSHAMQQHNLQTGWPTGIVAADGVFCRGSINFYWFATSEKVRNQFLAGLGSLIAAARWVWIAPWNKPAGLTDAQIDDFEASLAAWRQQHGLACSEPDKALQARYGIGYQILKVEIWTKALTRREAAGNPPR
jgi:hypothetical protein